MTLLLVGRNNGSGVAGGGAVEKEISRIRTRETRRVRSAHSNLYLSYSFSFIFLFLLPGESNARGEARSSSKELSIARIFIVNIPFVLIIIG